MSLDITINDKVGHKSEKPSVNNEFEPRPSVTRYSDDIVGYKGKKPSINSEFEPGPSASKYND